MSVALRGNWGIGFAYDVHTCSSKHRGVDAGSNPWDTTRTEMGELVYQLKNRGDRAAAGKIVDLLRDEYAWWKTMDAIIPIPSTNKNRAWQPVSEVARELGGRIHVPVIEDELENQSEGQELKNVDDPGTRKALLEQYLTLANRHDLSGQHVLLIDDLYRSGATLSVATEMLYRQAEVKNVSVFTMTKTRSKR